MCDGFALTPGRALKIRGVFRLAQAFDGGGRHNGVFRRHTDGSTLFKRFLIGGADAAESGRVAVGAVFADAGGIGLFNKGFVGGRRDAEGLPAAHGRIGMVRG